MTLGATNTDGTGNATLTLTVAQQNLTASGVTASNKVYDGTTAATISVTSASLVGVVGSDNVTLDASSAAGTFDTKNVGTAKPVTITGLALAGTNAANYTLTQPTATADITPKSLTVSGVTAADKVFDATTAATLNVTGATLVGVIAPDSVTLDTSAATGTFASAAVGAGQTVTVTGLTLGGPDSANYVLTAPTVVASITAASQGGGSTPTQASQTITFDALADRDSASGSFALNASASSGLPVTFSVVSGPATISGNTVTLTGGAGVVTIKASQSGDNNYLAAADVTRTFTVTPARTDRLINLSSRARVSGSGERALISGFVIGGTEPKRVLLRAVGPTLSSLGITDALANPRLRLFDGSGHVLLENDDWSGSETADAMAQTGAFSLPAGSHDAAVVTTLPPGAYTMLVMDGGQTGTVLAEVYDASTQSSGQFQRLVNISSRGMVDVNGGPLIGGFVNTDKTPKKVLIRGAGPSLAPYGISSVLADPSLKVYDGTGALIAQNDDWATPGIAPAGLTPATSSDISAAEQATGAFAFPAASKDAALIVTLAPGAYTAVVSGSAGATGVARVEIYETP